MTSAAALRKLLDPWFQTLQSDEIEKLTVILRVDGSLGTFGPEGVESIELDGSELVCELVIRDWSWGDLDAEQTNQIVHRQVLGAIEACFERYPTKYNRRDLYELVASAA